MKATSLTSSNNVILSPEIITSIQRSNPALNALGTHSSFLQAYNTGMKINLEDKLSFIKEGIPNYEHDVTVIFDFGCADGSLLHEIQKRDHEIGLGEKTYIGYDIAPDMIERAKNLYHETGLIFTDNLNEALSNVRQHSDNGRKSVLVLSSIIHEIVHYQSQEEQHAFWEQVWGSGADYVAIRDFSVPKGMEHEQSDPEAVSKIKAAYKDKVFPEKHPMVGQNILQTWEQGFQSFVDLVTNEHIAGFQGWGSIENKASMVHFLMTFDRIIHPRMWEADQNANLHLKGLREIKENYMSLPFEDFVTLVPTIYTPIYFDRGVTGLREKKVKETFGIELDVPTKIKLILKRRDNSDFRTMAGHSEHHTTRTFLQEYEINQSSNQKIKQRN